MNSPRCILLAAPILAVLALSPPAAGREPSRDSDRASHEGGAWGWIIVSDGTTSMSDMSDLESLDRLQSRFGSRFLYLRDGADRYVIRDEKLIERALRATRSIKLFGKEIEILARYRIHGTLMTAKSARKIAAIEGRQPAAGGSPADESNRRLERDFHSLIEDMETLRSDEPSAKSRALERRSEALSDRLQNAVRDANRELRDILREAKARHVASRLD